MPKSDIIKPPSKDGEQSSRMGDGLGVVKVSTRKPPSKHSPSINNMLLPATLPCGLEDPLRSPIDEDNKVVYSGATQKSHSEHK